MAVVYSTFNVVVNNGNIYNVDIYQFKYAFGIHSSCCKCNDNSRPASIYVLLGNIT